MDMGEKVKYHLDQSGDTSYFIQKVTGVRAKAIDSIRNGDSKTDNITLKTVFSILAYFQGTDYEKEVLEKLRFVLDSDYSSYRLSMMMRYYGKDGHEHRPSDNNIIKLRKGTKKLSGVKVYFAKRLLEVYDRINVEEPIK